MNLNRLATFQDKRRVRYMLIDWALQWFVKEFVIHCILPIFLFLLVFTLGLKDFEKIGTREFMKNIPKNVLNSVDPSSRN